MEPDSINATDFPHPEISTELVFIQTRRLCLLRYILYGGRRMSKQRAFKMLPEIQEKSWTRTSLAQALKDSPPALYLLGEAKCGVTIKRFAVVIAWACALISTPRVLSATH